jgi:hypothetical protein
MKTVREHYVCENDDCNYFFEDDKFWEKLDARRMELMTETDGYPYIFCQNCKIKETMKVIETTEDGFRFVVEK